MNPDTNKDVRVLETLRDEVRLQMHLAGMEAKDCWSKLEPRIEDALIEAREVGKQVLKDLVAELEEFTSAVKSVAAKQKQKNTKKQ